jgi:secreted PhoX family phosphatase
MGSTYHPPMTLDRRTLLTRGIVLGGAVVAAGPVRLFGGAAAHARKPPPPLSPYGPLVDNGGDIRLPAGFTSIKFGAAGTPMSDGTLTPSAHDGMGVFDAGNGLLAIVRNHEMEEAGPALADACYDALAAGGCTTTIWDPTTGQVVSSFVSLAGTATNCAGGPTPWGTWLSCEETTEGSDAGFGRPHGYVFEVSAGATGPVVPQPLTAMGRFVHEAAAVDPTTGFVYLTEDEGPGDGFYRFRPAAYGVLSAGVLEMAAIVGAPGYDTRSGQTVGTRLPVQWVPIPDPDPADAEANASAVFQQGVDQGGAVFVALEGCSYGDGAIFLSASDGGDKGLGQLWRFDIATSELVLLYESTDSGRLDGPDNNAATPRGGVAVCEDGDSKSNFVRGLGADGTLFDFAENMAPASEFPGSKVVKNVRSEFAGIRYSPDGQWMFVNIQYPGATYAITGPWHLGPL